MHPYIILSIWTNIDVEKIFVKISVKAQKSLQNPKTQYLEFDQA